MRLIRSDIFENLKMALATLGANKLRSFLTVIGVMIGVITVMLISSIISGVDTAVKTELESYGTNTIYIIKFNSGIHIGRLSREERMRKELTYDDAIALQPLPAVELAVPFLDISNNFFGQKITVTGVGKTSNAVALQGTLPDFERAGTEIVKEGRFFSQYENDTNSLVCVVGSSIAADFFPSGEAVGQELGIGGYQFRVVGVLEKREQFLLGGGSDSQNSVIYMPFNVARKLKPNSDDVMILAVARKGMMDEAKDEITDVLRVRRQVPFGQPDNFGMQTAELFLSNFRSILSGVAIAMVVISSVGLMVGGIGVMNIMLVSVTERTREIGVRKAIGARRSDIMWQFLIEAATLTGFGGLVGLTIGWLMTFLLRLILPSYVPLWAPIGGFVASVAIGMIFGIWPAWKAARLDPIESLRYE
ncbi:MAG: putative transport system permease protein [Blastocatellia bacterium]|jgi:ABC-type antimicrobial peptide transport system permease subunit|nr:putative transport system permease protein [Blastocatellia bacterium]